MKIKLTKSQKVELLKCIQSGFLDTEIIPELRKYEPARILTTAEAKALWNDLENGEFEKV